MTVSPAVPSRGHRPPEHRALLQRILAAALAAVHPAPVTAVTVRRMLDDGLPDRVHVVALGKAAEAMARAAVDALAERGREPVGGIVVAPRAVAPPHPALDVAVGDHPLPGPGSRSAAERLGDVAAEVRPDDVALVLLSGGTSSLVGAPVDGVAPEELRTLTRVLLGAGADIGFVNAVRRRVARWGAGRLAVALAPARVVCLVLSDVPGYPPSLVGSGPCAPDPLSASDVVTRLRQVRAWNAVPVGVRRRLAAAAAGGAPDVPSADDPAFARVTVELLADNATACAAAVAAARAEGLAAELHAEPLAGEARELGARLGAALRGAAPGTVHVWGGEPAVTLDGAPSNALGGRVQELALAAARALASPAPRHVALLAAGTDGRDGPTDAAGAIVDGTTWARIASVGRDPAADLAAHRSHASLDAVGALLRTGLTGTNVADLVLGVVAAPAAPAPAPGPSGDAISE